MRSGSKKIDRGGKDERYGPSSKADYFVLAKGCVAVMFPKLENVKRRSEVVVGPKKCCVLWLSSIGLLGLDLR